MPTVLIGSRKVDLTNLDKVFWPEGYTKGDLVGYYHRVAPYVLRYLKDRPIVMSRYPDGINGKHFYQKEKPEYTPEWIETLPVAHEGAQRVINYIVCRDEAHLVWIANQGAIEVHAWLGRAGRLEYPDLAVLDLDPAAHATWRQVIDVARLARTVLAEFGLAGFPKTSGATGVHIFIPLEPVHTNRERTRAMEAAARLVTGVCAFATTERAIERRTGKVYIDYLQNTAGKTMAFPYSVRPHPSAPVSTPVTWDELESLKASNQFNIRTVPDRLQNRGGPLCRAFQPSPSSGRPAGTCPVTRVIPFTFWAPKTPDSAGIHRTPPNPMDKSGRGGAWWTTNGHTGWPGRWFGRPGRGGF